ncbi:MAG TPA: glycoside hydrolase family 32 protein [Terracidiphilus sp.]|nr:glycoside hydrolase family 32 protein [Terracidiphilus sp.]
MQHSPRTLGRRAFLRTCGAAGVASALLPALARRGFALDAPDPAPNPADDPLRPEYHLMPPQNWMNDPNGPIWWRGKYHLFYQLNPRAAVWGDMHWGHAVSTDMIHWHHEPIALAPTPGGADSAGCFSGSAVDDHGVPTIVYTGVRKAPPDQVTLHDAHNNLRESQMLATAEDAELLHWKKDPTPVIAAPPAGMDVTGFRDPCPWRERDGWYLAVGSGQRGKGGCALLYRSPDLRHWTYLHPLAQGKPTGSTAPNPVDSGDMWECPDFFEVDGHHVLLYSTQRKVFWTTGNYGAATHRYTPSRTGILDYGAYYAPKSFLAPGHRRILWGWIRETRPPAEYAAAGWAGAMSLPRVLGVSAAGRLTMQFAPEVVTLRQGRIRTVLHDNTVRHALPHLRQEVMLRATPMTSSATVRLLVAGSPVWSLKLDFAAKRAQCGDHEFALPAMNPAEPALRLFLDASVIEAIAGGMQAITSRCYQLKPDATTLEVSAEGKGGTEFTRWPLRPISPNRMTT